MDPFAFEHKRVPYSVVASRIQTADMEDLEAKNPMNISLILRHVFMSLPVDDLIACSLVCNQWKTEARSVLRDFKKSLALIDTCGSFRRFCRDLAGMADMPYNGISFRVVKHSTSICVQKLESKDYSSILSGRNFILKFLSLDLPPWGYEDEGGNCTEKCFRVQFIPKLLQAHAHSLEGITLRRIPATLEFNKETLDFALPKLTGMWLLDGFSQAESVSHFCPSLLFQNFLKMTINLTAINVIVNSDDLKSFPSSFRRCIKSFSILGHGPAPTSRLARASPKLVRLDMDHYEHYPSIVGFKTHCEAIEKLLTSSSTTLECLQIDTSTAAALYRMDLEVVSKLTDLTIIGPPDHFRDRRLLVALQAFNFAQIFPKVYKIQVSHTNAMHPAQAYLTIPGSAQVTPEDVEGSDWKRNSITELCLKNCHDGNCAPRLGKVFKNIKTLEAHSMSDFPRSLWSCFESSLEEMSLYFRLTTSKVNFDAKFCGIHLEEARDLQQKDAEFLQNVHITPVFPSLLGMTKLKSLHLDVSMGPDVGQDLEDPRFFLTKLTALLAFNRMPNLRTLVEGEGVKRGLRHLRPLATTPPKRIKGVMSLPFGPDGDRRETGYISSSSDSD